MPFFRVLRGFLAVPTDNSEPSRSQLQAFSRQIPLLYLLLMAITVALAPAWLTLCCPLVLCAARIARHDFEQAREGLGTLKRCGARISLDDFRTGHSGLSCVRGMPLDRIEIDRSFITEIERSSAARDVVKTVADLCRNLAQGCRLVPAYLFGGPPPAEAVVEFLHKDEPNRREGDRQFA